MINKTYPIAEKILSQGQQWHQSLLTLLEKEADYLKKTSAAAAIAEIAEQKKHIAQQLEQFSQQMTQVLATESLDFNPVGIKDYFDKAQAAGLDTQKAQASWRQISSQIRQCHLLNEQNGASIALLMRHNQRVQQIIRGKHQQTTTYTANGSTSSAQFSRAIASA